MFAALTGVAFKEGRACHILLTTLYKTVRTLVS
jgi:hypothetical protein